MKLNVAVQMDPLEHIRIQGDSTFAMMLEAQDRGHDLFVYTPDRLALGWVLGGLALNVLTIGPLGFTLASVLLFVCVTRGFGSRQLLRDAAIGGAFALVAYLGFAKTLNINIGAGLVENGIEWLIATVRGR